MQPNPGSAQALYLIVSDVAKVERKQLPNFQHSRPFAFAEGRNTPLSKSMAMSEKNEERKGLL